MKSIMDDLARAEAAVSAITQAVVARHRTVGALTWALLHQLEAEILAEAARSGEHPEKVLQMLRAPKAMAYPVDDAAASFAGHGFVPIIFGNIIGAWNHLH